MSDEGSRPGRTGRAKTKPFRRKPRTLTVGGRTVTTRGLRRSFWSDFYSNAMTVGWGAFLSASFLIFVLTNALFALLYALAPAPVSNVEEAPALLLFFFSIETLATVGYGDMHPQTTYGHAVASLEMFCGLFLSALLTGLIFARFSRPRARFMFADVLTVAVHEGRPTIIVRVANARQNVVTDATAKLWFTRKRFSAEGIAYRGFQELRLERSENPIFVLTWSLFHPLDEASPLFGMTVDDMRDCELSLLLALTGTDAATSQLVQGRHDYSLDDVRWNHRYVDVVGEDENGDRLIDYARFHEVQALPASPELDQLASASIAS